MSSMLVGSVHIDVLLTAGLARRTPPLRWRIPGTNPVRYDELTFDTADGVGVMLLLANAEGVCAEYGDVVPETFTNYRFRELRGPVHPVVVLKAIDFFEYQSCGAADWADSEAAAFCTALRREMIQRLYGYEEAPWGISNRNVFLAR